MQKQLFSLTILLLLIAAANAQVLIKNVNVVDVEKKKILSGYNVVALDGKIVSIDKGRTYKLPEGTEVIDGTDKYLVPGFVDAHVHFFQSGSLYTRPDAFDLRKFRPYEDEIKWTKDNMSAFAALYTRMGITSVIDVGSSNNFLKLKPTVEKERTAPVIAMTGPLLTTWVPKPFAGLNDNSPFIFMSTVDSTRMAVRMEKEAGAEFLKIWYIAMGKNKDSAARKNLHLVSAAIDEAHKIGMRVAVHATERITAQLAVEAGADFLVHNIEDEIVSDDFIKLLKKKKVVLCPTMVVGENYGKSMGGLYQFSTDELNQSHPHPVTSVIDFPSPDSARSKAIRNYYSSDAAKQQQAHDDSITYTNLKKMAAAGVIIATGTDAGNIGTQHVGSYHIELRAMAKAGMNNWQLLQASTINGAKAVGREKEWGSLANGKLANMVLLNANPVDSLSSWTNINRVINRGIVFRPDTLVKHSPEMLAQQQLNAYNAHDLEAFLEPYADSVEIYDLPGNIQIKGKEEMRKSYAFLKNAKGLHCRIVNRIVQGNVVIDHEEITGIPNSPFRAVAVYVIENGKIAKVYFPNP